MIHGCQFSGLDMTLLLYKTALWRELGEGDKGHFVLHLRLPVRLWFLFFFFKVKEIIYIVTNTVDI